MNNDNLTTQADVIAAVKKIGSTPEIIVNTDSFYESSSIIGKIYFQIGDFFFPEEGWDDFAVVILSWWLHAFKNSETVFSMLFMDGPFEVNVVRSEGKTLELTFIHKEKKLFIVSCAEEVLKKQLLNAARKILIKSSQENWTTSAIAGLQKVILAFE